MQDNAVRRGIEWLQVRKANALHGLRAQQAPIVPGPCRCEVNVDARTFDLEPLADGQTRREFCQRVCQIASLAAVGGLVTACGGGGGPTSPTDVGSSLPVVGGSRVNGVTTVDIAAGSPLASTGGMALVQAGAVDFLVTRTGDASFVALTAICTHQQCTVSNFSGSLFVCPCHGSEYTTSGSVARGPAGAPLRTFATQFADPLLTISG